MIFPLTGIQLFNGFKGKGPLPGTPKQISIQESLITKFGLQPNSPVCLVTIGGSLDKMIRVNATIQGICKECARDEIKVDLPTQRFFRNYHGDIQLLTGNCGKVFRRTILPKAYLTYPAAIVV